MLCFFGLFSSAPETNFSLHQSDKHKYEQKSFYLNVPFFVSNKYFQMSPREKQNIQYQIERDHLQSLQTLCETEYVK